MISLKSRSWFETQLIEIEDIVLEFTYSPNITNFSYHLTEIPHIHFEYELHFIIDGECPVCVDDKDYIITENSVCIVPKKANHYFPGHSGKCEGFGMMMTVKYNDKFKNNEKSSICLDKLFEFPNEFKIIQDNKKIDVYIRDFLCAYKNKGFGSDCIKRSSLTLIFLEILNELGGHKFLKTSNAKDNNTSESFVLETYLMNNYNKNISLKDVSDVMGFSVAHTARIIKKYYGVSYSKLILDLRMARAKKKIISTDKSFSEIAIEVGYGSYNGFGMAFKGYFGKTPEQMRNESKLCE